MNYRTLFALLAILTMVGTLTTSSVYAGEAYPSIGADTKEKAKQMLLKNVPIYIWTDKAVYEHNDTIKVSGEVANWSMEVPVTLTVTNPLNNVVAVDQLKVDGDGKFETTITTAGELWKYDGTYVIKVNYGSVERSNKILVELEGSTELVPMPKPPMRDDCMMLDIPEETDCITFDISGGSIMKAGVNTDDNILVIKVDATDDGMLMLNLPQSVINGVFMVLVDDEEWDDAEINGNNVTVMFPAGTEKIEIVGTWVIPEFGTIAAMILVVAIVSIIAVTSRSRLVMPRY